MTDSPDRCVQCGAPVSSLLGGEVCALCLLTEADQDFDSPGRGQTTPNFHEDVRMLQRFGPYELMEEIGRGGMGVIYKARQPGLDRMVALKMLLAGEFADAKARERLLREARIAARLSHPGIITIFDVGEQEGRPYFAMEYVPGRNLAQICREGLLPLKTTVRYVEQLARAVDYAHQHGVIHRDLKPSNVLLGPDDEPKLTDFGLTKSLVDPTQTMESAGSPNFMAPEQADSKLGITGTHTDIFGLGAILYFLLTGHSPVVGESLAETVHAAATADPIPPRRLRPTLPVDLETITLKCLEKEAGRRYGSAREVAEELARWQRHEPIQARPTTPVKRLGKWIRRRPVIAGLAAACTLAVIAGFSGVTWQWRRAETQAEAASRASYAATLGVVHQQLEAGSYLAARLRLFALPERFRGWEWGRLLSLAHREILESPVFTNGWTGYLDQSPAPATSLDHQVSPDRRWVACWGSGRLEILNLTNQASVFRLGSGTNRVMEAAFSPAGDRFVTAGPGPEFALWSCGDWRQIRTWTTLPSAPSSIRFSPDGRQLVTTDGSPTVRLSEAASGQPAVELAGPHPAYESAWFTPDGKRVVGAYRRGAFQRFTIWDATEGRILAEVPGTLSDFRTVELTADATQFVTVDERGVASLWRVDGEQRPIFETPPEGDQIIWATASPEHSRLVTMRFPSYQARFWDTKTVRSLPVSPTPFSHVRIGSDGRTLLSCANAQVHVWDWDTGQPSASFGIGEAAVHARCNVTGDGRLVSALISRFPINSTIHVWPIPGSDRRIAPPNTALRAALAPDGETVALGHVDSRISLWNSRSGARMGWLEGHYRSVNDLAWVNGGKTLFSASGDHTVRRWNVPDRRLEATFTNLTRSVWTLSATPDGRRVAAADLSGRVAVWDGRTGVLVRDWEIPRENELLPIQMVRLSPDGRLMVATGFTAAGVWSVDTGERLARFNSPGTGAEEDVVMAGFSDDGQRLVTVNRTGRVRTWDALAWGATRQDRVQAITHSIPTSPDGRRIFLTWGQMISAYVGEVAVQVLDGATATPLLRLERHRGWGSSISYHAPRRRLLHTVIDSDSPAWGTELMDALPWHDHDFPGFPREPLEKRVERFARAELWSRLQEPLARPEPPPPLSPEPRSNWSPRDPATPPECVDLTAAYNAHLETGWLPDYQFWGDDNNLAALPRGVVRLSGHVWDIRGVIATGQPERSPLEPWVSDRIVAGVPLQVRARRLHFLHASTHAPPMGQLAGRYRLHFTNGRSADLELRMGEDLGDWWTRSPGMAPHPTSVAWEGESPAATRAGAKVQLYHRVWDNPFPNQGITSMDLLGEGEATVFVIALTAER